jgi:hypothetical protein
LYKIPLCGTVAEGSLIYKEVLYGTGNRGVLAPTGRDAKG